MKLVPLIFVVLAVIAGNAGAQAPVTAGFRPLFNGRDLTGWVNVNCAPGTWAATNGLIFCTGTPTGELRTERMYQNFILELEWRHLRAKGNAGVFVWADALTARGQPFIRGVEVQVLDGLEGPGHTSDGDIFPIHGARMIPENGRGGDRAFPTEKRMKPSPEWNHYRIECVDGAISLAVNGKIVTRGREATPRKGYICLESEGSPVEFRNVRIQELPAAVALAPEHIATPDDGFMSLYDGLSLSGWNHSAGVQPSWRPTDWTLVTGGDPAGKSMVHSVPLGDGVVVMDWRWTDEKRPGEWASILRLRGLDLRPVLAGAAGASEEAVGKWNRAIFRLRGNRLNVELNGKPLGEGFELRGAPPTGPLVLTAPPVPTAVANLFVRRLD